MIQTGATTWWGGMSQELAKRFLGSYAYVDIAELASGGASVILPIGAVEQHGPHLPVFTDTLISQSLVVGALERLPKHHSFYFLYPLAYSYSMEHIDFPGTMALSATTTMQVLFDLADSLARSGFRKLVLVNGHGGNVGLLHVVAREIRLKTGLWVFVIHGGTLMEKGVFDEREGAEGIHAGAAETSLLMALMPAWVEAERADGEYPALIPSDSLLSIEGNFPVAWKTRDISESGVVGDASQASAELGEKLFEGMTRKLAEVLEDIQQFAPTGEQS